MKMQINGNVILRIEKRNTMQKAQKKPVIIEFIQLKESNILEVYTEIHGKPNRNCQMAEDRWDDYEEIVIHF